MALTELGDRAFTLRLVGNDEARGCDVSKDLNLVQNVPMRGYGRLAGARYCPTFPCESPLPACRCLPPSA